MAFDAVVMGASAGGIDALKAVFRHAGPLPWPVLVVLHVLAHAKCDFASLFADAPGPVLEAADKQMPRGGSIYFAPPGYHLLVERDGRLSLSVEEPVLWSRPAIDVLFETAALAHGPRLVGVVLSGASADGAEGLAQVTARGGLGVAQDPASAMVGTMPRAAIARAAPRHVLAPEAIGRLLAALSRERDAHA